MSALEIVPLSALVDLNAWLAAAAIVGFPRGPVTGDEKNE